MTTPNHLCVGLMSGTSMDGIDIALINTNGIDQTESIASAFYPYPPIFQQALKCAERAIKQARGDLALAAPIFIQQLEAIDIEALAKFFTSLHIEQISVEALIQASTALHIQAVQNFLDDRHIPLSKIEVIGYHGQTFYHAPHDKITLQLGDAQHMADILQRPVVGQFRLNDVAQGGQGAPLAPLYHWVLAMQEGLLPVGIINCGGIANVTLIIDEDPAHMLAFDMGPGNVLIDRYVREKTHQEYLFDRDGHWALAGTPQAEALAKFFEEALPRDYLTKAPPKSLDSYDCLLPSIVENLSREDACASLAMFTAACMIDGLSHTTTIPTRWVLAGGGWANAAISASFAELLQNKIGGTPQISTARALGWEHDALEAEAFAFLAKRCLLELPISFPGTTGVPEPLTGGIVYRGQLCQKSF